MNHSTSFDNHSRPWRHRARPSSSSFVLDPQLRVEHEDDKRERRHVPSPKYPLGVLGVLILIVALGPLLFTGCESTGGGSASVSGGMYYGSGFYDPWYYGGYYDDPDIIVTPPARPERPPHVEHPIARPMPAPRPMPSIPSAPRASVRR
jgi:hypothetical protein